MDYRKAFSQFLIGGSGGSDEFSDLGLALLRVFAGLALALGHGLGKIPPSEGFVEGVMAMGFPFPLVFAWMAALAETAGGLLLTVGLLTRPSALFLFITMFVAALVRHAADPFKTKELALVYLFVAVVFLMAGAGRYSIDYVLRQRNGGE